MQLIQGTPLLVILFMTFFGLPQLGFNISPLAAAGLSLTIYVGAYLGEIWRGCIESVPKAQWEAAECLALTRAQRMRMVMLPQAIRIATPPTVGFMVQIVKNTSLASVVGFVELARSAQIMNNSVFEPFLIYLIIAAIYFALCYPLSRWSLRLERRGASASPAATGGAPATGQPVPHMTSTPMDSNGAAVVLRDVHKSFGANKVLAGVNLDAQRGQVTAIIGRSGSGKSTALRCIDRLERDRQRPDHRLRPPGRRSQGRPEGAAAGPGHRVPELQPVPAPDHRREHHAGAARRQAHGQGAGAARSRTRCWPGSA